jgi:pyruvate ferredoxin oxidoreductase delta subunit
MLCWAFCPDGSILVEEGKVTGIDLAHCKGCGICAQECPRKAISIVEESLAEK